jgi:hypothetical protein
MFPFYNAFFCIGDDVKLLHSHVSAGTVPVKNIWLAGYHIAFFQGLLGLNLDLVKSSPIGDEQDLSCRMRMPVTSGARFKVYIPYQCIQGAIAGNKPIVLHLAGEGLRIALSSFWKDKVKFFIAVLFITGLKPCDQQE